MGCTLECGNSKQCGEGVSCVVITRDWEVSPDTCVSQCQFPNLVEKEVELGVNLIIVLVQHVGWSILNGECIRVE